MTPDQVDRLVAPAFPIRKIVEYDLQPDTFVSAPGGVLKFGVDEDDGTSCLSIAVRKTYGEEVITGYVKSECARVAAAFFTKLATVLEQREQYLEK